MWVVGGVGWGAAVESESLMPWVSVNVKHNYVKVSGVSFVWFVRLWHSDSSALSW